MKVLDKSTVEFSTGTRRYATYGIIGIDDEGSVSEGFSGGFYCADESGKEYGSDEEPLTRDELLELSDEMIKRWTKFKAEVLSNPTLK
jgi:hypothetical protein